MKKCLFMVLMLGALIVYAQQETFSFKAEVDGKQTIFSPGDKVPLKLIYTCPKDYRLSGWYIQALVQNLPPTFCKVMNVKPGSNPKWPIVHFTKWKWFKPGQEKNLVEFTTENWPEGDYKLIVSTIFRKNKKSDLKTDKYLNSHIVFTLEK